MAAAVGRGALMLTGCKTFLEFREWICSTYFWAPVLNWSLPAAAIGDLKKTPEIISGRMTVTLGIYSCMFMRFAVRMRPQNMLLFAMHFTNVACQIVQLGRLTHYEFLLSPDQRKECQKYYKALAAAPAPAK